MSSCAGGLGDICAWLAGGDGACIVIAGDEGPGRACAQPQGGEER